MAATATRGKRGYRMVARAEATAATRTRLLEAAWRHFAERPFDDVRLADVARDGGVSAQTLHNHFRTKDALFVAAWQWTMAPEGAARCRALASSLRGWLADLTYGLFARARGTYGGGRRKSRTRPAVARLECKHVGGERDKDRRQENGSRCGDLPAAVSRG